MGQRIPAVTYDRAGVIENPTSKKENWLFFTKVMPGKDDVVRVVEVKTKNGTYTRPVAQMFKLEDNE